MASLLSPAPLALLLALSAVSVLPSCTRDGLPTYVVHRARGPISIDGILAEPDWDRARSTGAFTRSLDGKPASASTEARLLWDDHDLFVAFQAEDPRLGTPFSKDDEPLYTSNVVEIFLVPGAPRGPYAEIELAPSNALFDARFTGRREGMDLAWSSGTRHAVRLDGTLNDDRDQDRGWTAELAIPLSTLPGVKGPVPARGEVWRMNLYRLRQGPGQPGEGQAWSAPLVGDFHALERFGALRFED
jgi:hypothetical protein